MQSLFSQTWYRVKDLRPALHAHVEVHRHRYRNQTWYVIQDHAKGSFHRFTPEANYIIGLFDGKTTLDEIWKRACEVLGDDMPTQDEVISLLARLHEADALKTDLPPDMRQMVERAGESRRKKLLQKLKSPLAIKIPLFDPDRFLNATMPFVRPFFSKWGLLGWCLLIGYALMLAVLHFDELTNNVGDRVFSTGNVILIGLLYPVIKLIHEFGHAWSVKRWGGEVHEMGVMLLVFMPLPYVDASSSAAFRDRKKRMLVAAAGMVVELVLASLAMIVWVNVEPGLVRSAAFNVMLIAGVSTLLFNGNPLLRFDAYYILADLLEIPNFATRANQYIGYLIKRYLLRLKDLESPAERTGGEVWLFVYAIASFIYRLFLMLFIAIFVAGKFFFIGVLLALYAVYSMLVAPVFRILGQIHRDPVLRRHRGRIVTLSTAVLAIILVVTVAIPFPLVTAAEGVVWVPERSRIRAATPGFIREVVARSGQQVRKGQLLLRCEDPEITVRIRKLEAELREFQARYRAVYEERVQARVLREEITRVQAELRQARERQAELLVRSPASGRLVLPESGDLPGRYVTRGTMLGYVIPRDRGTVRVVIRQDEIGNVRQGIRRVQVRLASQLRRILPARVLREVPSVGRELPSPVLGQSGGGRIVLDPADREGQRAFERIYQFELGIGVPVSRIGERVFVRFEHVPRSLAWRWYRGLRRLFLREFDV